MRRRAGCPAPSRHPELARAIRSGTRSLVNAFTKPLGRLGSLQDAMTAKPPTTRRVTSPLRRGSSASPGQRLPRRAGPGQPQTPADSAVGPLVRKRSDERGVAERLRGRSARTLVDVATWTAQSRARQSLPARVTDETTLRRVAMLLVTSGSPFDADAIGIEAVASTHRRADGDGRNERLDDSSSATERQRRPPAA